MLKYKIDVFERNKDEPIRSFTNECLELTILDKLYLWILYRTQYECLKSGYLGEFNKDGSKLIKKHLWTYLRYMNFDEFINSKELEHFYQRSYDIYGKFNGYVDIKDDYKSLFSVAKNKKRTV